ncbi:hypothetical protein CORC01_13535 [Colletotrichum orchidophilum]|uniref:DUF6594 domain-containing protein n=1 Tax=Colletotrichum orchidophilum TaxID=1209926 RepID=A0A1G4APR6_9PEZI|nr:uncharacterized protein CORC01_13535 [Colletotrichum orchidophilum]OHE91159.1 hypothetical protein CORC01_13535 [Colletotrichum orchidophilum]
MNTSQNDGGLTGSAFQDSGRFPERGYGNLANLFARSPEVAIFRKFGYLSMMNLLRLQSELQELEQQLEDTREEDRNSTDPIRREYESSFRTMKQYAEDSDSIQYELLIEIRKKLEEYQLKFTVPATTSAHSTCQQRTN